MCAGRNAHLAARFVASGRDERQGKHVVPACLKLRVSLIPDIYTTT